MKENRNAEIDLSLPANKVIIAGFAGKILVSLSFVLGYYVGPTWLLLSIIGLSVDFMANSYLKANRSNCYDGDNRWSSLVSGLTMEGVGGIIIIFGFMIYVGSPYFLLGLLLLLLYSWRSTMSLLRYRIKGVLFDTDEFFGSDKIRILGALMILTELIFPWSIIYSALFMIALLFAKNIIDLNKLFAIANKRDKEEEDTTNPKQITRILNRFFIRDN